MEIPEPTLRRLPWYLAYVTMLRSQGVEYVSSTHIAENLDVDSSQIAKDLSYIDIKGKTRIGYEVKELEERLVRFLGFQHQHNAVVVGAGSLGAALMRDSGLERYGLNIVAGFDTDPAKAGSTIAGTPVYSLDSLPHIHSLLEVKVAIITVPFDSAQTAADLCMDAGISGIWNFTPRRIRVRDGVVIQNTSIYSNLAVMYNRLESANSE
ncbi:MAG: redox-sensing transcriptional repressor Rex [Muribaculaceae bacterium]|nr:redox-sensing transcriptional repressor Rex [Muribaculaceae bacterium]